MKEKRPIGFTILAIILWWLTLGGIANAALHMGGMHPIWPLAYAVTAFVAALGLWKVKAWAFQAFLAWSTVVVLVMFVMQHGHFKVPLPMFIGFACFMLVLLSLGAFYIKKTIIKTVEELRGQAFNNE